jgi:signal transduction histidine kinase/ActR/RegA family two-component response regulator
MSERSRLFARLLRYFGAHNDPEMQSHELDRAWQRMAVSSAITVVWLFEEYSGLLADRPSPIFLVVAVSYLVASLVYRRLLKIHLERVRLLLYAFLILDPVMVVLVLATGAQTFAFLNPFLLFMIVRTGIRYGMRTMYLAWSSTLVASLILLSSEFWRTNGELALAFFLMLLLVPALFGSLIRRVHNVRAIEAERARLSAMSEFIFARSAFLAKVSHELRSPLQGIVSALDVLELRHGRSGEDEIIGRIRRSSLLLNTHLRDLLTLARGEAGRLEMRPEPFEACALVESVAAAAGPLSLAKRLALVVDVPPHAVFVVADGARIDQILTNLVINSIRYTDVGQVRLTMRPYDAAIRLLRFAVADTGPGIPADVLPTLLAPDRAQTGAERRGEGSGIGLAIVRTLVDHLGGKVEVTSAMGQGTTFTIEIPAEPLLDTEEERAEPGSATGRVLVVDDRDDVLDALASVVDELGFECDRASSAAVGANLLASRPYDVALVDLEMPLKGGAALAADTRSGHGPNRATRFVAMSASAVSQDVGRHFDACLSKPIDQAALRQVLLSVAPSARPSQPGLWSEGG